MEHSVNLALFTGCEPTLVICCGVLYWETQNKDDCFKYLSGLKALDTEDNLLQHGACQSLPLFSAGFLVVADATVLQLTWQLRCALAHTVFTTLGVKKQITSLKGQCGLS